MPHARQPRVVIAGQVPPPYGGQNVMIGRIFEELKQSDDLETRHLVFEFTPTFKTVRRGNLQKVWELFKVLMRLARLRMEGPIDLLLYPVGGPQTVPIIRDILLLPWILLFSRRVVLHFHAAGIADRLAAQKGIIRFLLQGLYGRCVGALVMTPFNRRDPYFFDISRVCVVPHKLPDEFDSALIREDASNLRVLAVGHLCPDKGTPALLRAFAAVSRRNPRIQLELVGECLPPMTDADLRAQLRELGIENRVVLSGVLTGRAKQEAFGRAHVFAFPSIAPYESFGLVMVEAMMWGLPIVATDWRGNRDVLGGDFDGVCFAIGNELAASLETALEAALQRAAQDARWGERNRNLYESRYRFNPRSTEYPALLRSFLEDHHAKPNGTSDSVIPGI